MNIRNYLLNFKSLPFVVIISTFICQANSVMSSMSSIHPVSCMSGVSSLPDEFGGGLQEHPFFQHLPASIRHEDPEKMRQVLPDLVPLINDESEEVVLRALTIMRSIAKKDKELAMARAVEGPLIGDRRVVEELLRTLRTHRKNKAQKNKQKISIGNGLWVFLSEDRLLCPTHPPLHLGQ